MSLNEQQQAAYDALCSFIESKQLDQMFLLKGYAGTGKTYTISRFIEALMKKHPRWQIAMTAPTNKAVQVLRESADIKRGLVEFKTIYSLLGKKEVLLDNGDVTYERDFNEQAIIAGRFKVVIIDEVSMLQDSLFFDLKRYRNDVKIIFMGDPAQIPPVGKSDCEPFLNPEEHGIIEVELTQIMRQGEGSAIVENSFMVREELLNRQYEWKPGKDFTIYSATANRSDIASVFESRYSPDNDKEHKNNARVVAYKRATVRKWNNYIRALYYGDSAKLNPFFEGELLIMSEPYEAETEGSAMTELLTRNQEVTVLGTEVKDVLLDDRLPVKVFRLKLFFQNRNFEMKRGYINVIHPNSLNDFESELQALRHEAIHADKSERKDKWRHFYRMLRSVAKVDYGYSITAHKSQGSTYSEAIVDVRDIMSNSNIYERNRIIYTAITRAKHNAIIIV